MLDFNINKLINKTLDRYYETFSHTLDTSDYVPQRYNNRILAYIFKHMKKQFRRINAEDRKYRRDLKKKARLKAKSSNRYADKKAAVSAYTAGAKAVLNIENKTDKEVNDNVEK